MPSLLAWRNKCPWHRVGVSRSAHDGKLSVLKEVEDLRHVVRELAAQRRGSLALMFGGGSRDRSAPFR